MTKSAVQLVASLLDESVAITDRQSHVYAFMQACMQTSIANICSAHTETQPVVQYAVIECRMRYQILSLHTQLGIQGYSID